MSVGNANGNSNGNGDGRANGQGQLPLSSSSSSVTIAPPAGSGPLPGPSRGTSTTNGSQASITANADAWTKAAGSNPTGSGAVGYDSEKFYTSSCDSRGHGEHIRIKFPPSILREIKEMLATGDFPVYGLIDDFIRDSVYHRLHQLGEQCGDPALRERQALFYAELDIRERTQRLLEATDFWPGRYDELNFAFKQLAEHKAWGQLWFHLRDSEEMVLAAAPEPWRANIISLIGTFRDSVPETYKF